MGGARRPDRRPRAPSGPGRLSQRTDLSAVEPPSDFQGVYVPPNQPYGDRARFEAGQAMAGIPAAPSPAGTRGGGGGAVSPSPGAFAGTPATPPLQDLLVRPTELPDEPVTTGLPGGPPPEPTTGDVSYLKSLAQILAVPGMPPTYQGLGLLLGALDGAHTAMEARGDFDLEPDFTESFSNLPVGTHWVEPSTGLTPTDFSPDDYAVNSVALALDDFANEESGMPGRSPVLPGGAPPADVGFHDMPEEALGPQPATLPPGAAEPITQPPSAPY